ncbi:MAG: UPF0280 family protein [Burkholderiales bacterium]|nr:UPF0280 family protein [Burkholderiales bacterium]
MSGALRARLGDGRWHFQHGPIDCIVFAEGESGAAAECIDRAWLRFQGVLDELVAELPLLRTDLSSAAGAAVAPRGPIARRMVAACRAHATGGRFLTAMAAVAGSVAEELIVAFAEPRIHRAYVNNGGDIALHLAPGAAFDVGLFTDPAHGLAALPLDGRFAIDSAWPVRGIATSGWRGRSFSLGIADAVTVLAASASSADAAATVIANAVDVDDPRIVRRPASEVRDDSDLGHRLVTCAVPLLPEARVAQALENGRRAAAREIAAGRIVAALLCLQGQARDCGAIALDHQETCP